MPTQSVEFPNLGLTYTYVAYDTRHVWCGGGVKGKRSELDLKQEVFSCCFEPLPRFVFVLIVSRSKCVGGHCGRGRELVGGSILSQTSLLQSLTPTGLTVAIPLMVSISSDHLEEDFESHIALFI